MENMSADLPSYGLEPNTCSGKDVKKYASSPCADQMSKFTKQTKTKLDLCFCCTHLTWLQHCAVRLLPSTLDFVTLCLTWGVGTIQGSKLRVQCTQRGVTMHLLPHPAEDSPFYHHGDECCRCAEEQGRSGCTTKTRKWDSTQPETVG